MSFQLKVLENRLESDLDFENFINYSYCHLIFKKNYKMII